MKTLLRIIILIISFMLIGGITTYIDYERINNNQKPVFVITNYNDKSNREVYTGLIYRVDRVCSVSQHEQISDSKSINFKVLGMELKLKSDVLKPKEYLNIKTKEETKCNNSKLIYADKDIKVYTYCLNEIVINSYGKDIPFAEYIKTNGYTKILNQLRFDGTTIDKNSLELIDSNNISNNGLKAIQCRIGNITDIYFGPNNMIYQEDFCTYKDDDFAFMWTIKDNHPKEFACPENSEPEVLFEDETNTYSFKCQMSDQVFVNVPSVRGKPEINIPIRESLDSNIVTFQEAMDRGLSKIITKETKTK